MPPERPSESTLHAPARREIRVLGSRFLADAHPVTGAAEARARRLVLEGEFPAATHHCWALRLRLPAGERELAADAGEPAGTAGVPILQALRRAGVINAQVIVVRWFGGTKLGKGGLARAYRDAARAALEAAGTVEMIPVARLRLVGPVGLDGEVRHTLARHGGRILSAAYGDGGGADLVAELPEAGVEALVEDLGRVTRGAWRHDQAGASPGPPEGDG
jgi:putative IMPACT (imprinted ancient) family translation regulator